MDSSTLLAYLRTHLPDADSIDIRQFPGGHSNLTYLVRVGGTEYVLRRAPLGPVAPKAHDMAREYGVLAAVHPHFPAAPRPVLLCQDTSVIGSVFFLMERRTGVILRNCVPPEFQGREQEISRAFVDCLADLHSVDVAATGLISLGRPEGFLDRQVRGWADRWQRAKTEEVPDVEAAISWLGARLPLSPRPSLVHNDFKLDNIMLDASDPGRVVAVLDWEMTTIGDPLADVGLTLCYWTAASRFSVTNGPGWYSRDQILEHYSGRTGLDVSAIGWYEVLGIFKLIVILQQIYQRYVRGQTRDERFRDFDKEVKHLAALTAERIGTL